MRNLVLSFGITLLCSGCALMPQYTAPLEPKYIDGPGSDLVPEKVERALTRANISGIAVQSLAYVVEMYPHTNLLMRTRESTQCKRNLEDPKTCSLKVERAVSDRGNRTCFEFSISAVDPGLAKSISYLMKVEQPTGAYQELQISQMSPIPKFEASGSERTWSNSGLACMNKKIDFASDFVVHVIPQVGDTRIPSAKLSWTKPLPARIPASR